MPPVRSVRIANDDDVTGLDLTVLARVIEPTLLFELDISGHSGLFEAFVNLWHLTISGNDALQAIDGVESLDRLSVLEIHNNKALQEIDGLGDTDLTWLRIYYNDAAGDPRPRRPRQSLEARDSG